MTRLSYALVLAAACGAGNAAAQDAPEPYIVKFQEGRALLKANKFNEALEKFEESLAIKSASGTLLNIGDCQEHLGRYASAMSSFEQARGLATESKQPEREKEAADRATKLQPLVSSITVKGPAGMKLAVDGGPAEADRPVPVDGGAHVIHVEAQCKRPKDLPVTVGIKSDAQIITVDLATFDPDPACNAPTTREHISTERLLAYVAGGAGVVALGFGIGFGISASSKESDLETLCPSYPNRCDVGKRSEIDAKYDAAHTAATFSTIGFVGAIVLIGGGVALYMISPEWRKRNTAFIPGRFTF